MWWMTMSSLGKLRKKIASYYKNNALWCTSAKSPSTQITHITWRCKLYEALAHYLDRSKAAPGRGASGPSGPPPVRGDYFNYYYYYMCSPLGWFCPRWRAAEPNRKTTLSRSMNWWQDLKTMLVNQRTGGGRGVLKMMSIIHTKYFNYFYTDDLHISVLFFLTAGARTKRREAVAIERSCVATAAPVSGGDILFFSDCEAQRSSLHHAHFHEQHT